MNDAEGISGQGTTNPVSMLPDHVIMKMELPGGAKYYDPSYGLTYANAAGFQSTIIAGYFIMSPMADGNYRAELWKAGTGEFRIVFRNAS